MRASFIATAFCMLCLELNTTSGEETWGGIKGKVTVTGAVPILPALVKEGDSTAKDASVCASQSIPDESIVIDPQSNGLANVVIWMAQKPAKIHPDLKENKNKEINFSENGCRFAPHILIVQTDQQVRVKSADQLQHNLHAHLIKNRLSGLVLKPSSSEGYLHPRLKDAETRPVKIRCDIHPWMEAYWVVVDHPYATVSNTAGEFEIANLPVGDHEIKVWHEKFGWIERSMMITVKAGDNTLTTFKVDTSVIARFQERLKRDTK